MSIAEEVPVFPLTVTFADGEQTSVESTEDAECNLEWIDSDDPSEPLVVVDKFGRRVRLKIEGLRIVRCELMKQDPAAKLHTASL